MQNYDRCKEEYSMSQTEYEEVYFHEYCEKCEYKDVDEVKDPCNECLSEPANLYSHKPVKFKEKNK